MLWALSALGFARKALQAAFGIVTRYPREAAIIVLVCLAAFFWHGERKANDRADAIEAQAKADSALWQKAHAANLASIKLLTDAINDQSARVRALAKASDARQRDAQAALARATARRDVSEGVAQRIERAGVSGGCRTAPEIMSNRGEL